MRIYEGAKLTKLTGTFTGAIIGARDSDLCQRPLDDIDEREEGEARGGPVED